MDTGGSEAQRTVLSMEDAASAFAAILHALSRIISPALIDGAGWDRLHTAIEGLPVDPGIGFGFELRLGTPAAETDFYIAFPEKSAIADHYIRRGECAMPGSAAAGLRDRLSTMDTDAPWSGILAVEYDVTSSQPDTPPGLFVRICPDSVETGAAGFPATKTVAEWIAGAVGWCLDTGELQALDRVFDGMVATGNTVDCLGIMPGRPGRTFKVNSRPMEPERVLPLLERLRWTGPASEVAAFLSASRKLLRSLRLAVGVSAEGVLPRIGLELFQGVPGSLSHPGVGEWGPFLAWLCEEGLCLPEKMDGLLAWPGREFVFCGQDTFGVLTGMTHVKVSFGERDAGEPVEAKAYPVAGYLTFDAIVPQLELR